MLKTYHGYQDDFLMHMTVCDSVIDSVIVCMCISTEESV